MAPVSSVLVTIIFCTKIKPKNFSQGDDYISINSLEEQEQKEQVSAIQDFKNKIQEMK